MKRNKIMFVIAIVAILAVLFVACDEGTQPEHTHTYGAWTVTTAPTEGTAGSATRACACGDVQTTTVAKLSDTSVWTVDASQDATHTSKGFKVYKSAYGTVTVTIEKTTGHTYGAWTLTKNPTTTETGTAKRSCVCGYEEETPVAALTDASVWKTATSQDPTHESKGFVQYTSEYGTVLVEVAAGQHTYNNWTLKTAPTLTETGLALKTCVCGHYKEETVAVLTDTTVWTKQHTDATHQAAGSDVYTSVYGTVTIVIPQIEHSFTGEYRDNADGTHSRKCTGCDAYSTAVEHDFSKKVIDDAHKATDADCTNAATYYYSCECGAVSTELTFENGTALGHDYSEFKVTKEPTCTETGIAESVCKTCKETQTNIIAANGHKFTQYAPIEFEDMYGNPYYAHSPKCEVCGYVNESKTEKHTYDTKRIHVSASGYVCKVCDKCDYIDEEESLGNISSWTVKESIAADYNKAGYTIYTKDTYEYRKEFAKLVAPYDGKTYYSYNIYINDSGVFAIETAWSSAQITFNENGVGTGTAYPFRGTTTIKMVNAETGEINWESGTDNFKGYVNFETGVIIRTRNGLFDDVLMMIPTSMTVTAKDVTGSTWTDSMAFAYNAICNLNETHTFNVFVYDEKVYFGAQFVDADGNAVAAGACSEAPYVKVLDAEGNKVQAFAQKNGGLTFTDGKEGTYTSVDNILKLDGVGGFVLNGKSGFYTVAAEDASYGYDAYVGADVATATEYYQITLGENNTCTVVKPEATLSFGGEGVVDVENITANVNIVTTLPTLVREGYVFNGWQLNGEGDARSTFVAEASKEYLFEAQWTKKATVTVRDLKDEDKAQYSTAYVGVGNPFVGVLPAYDENTYRDGYKFVGWYLDVNKDNVIDNENDLPLGGTDTAETADEDYVIFAVWNWQGNVEFVKQSQYGWEYVAETNSWRSTNWHKGSTSSVMEIEWTSGVAVVEFDYWVTGEQGFDYLTIYYYDATGESKEIKTKGTDIPQSEAKHVVAVLSAEGQSVRLSYSKDSSGNGDSGEEDRAFAVNLTINGVAMTAQSPLNKNAGTYTSEGAEDIKVSAGGTVTIGENTYLTSNVSEKVIGVMVGDVYKEYTLDTAAKTYMVVEPKVTVAYNYNGNGTNTSAQVGKYSNQTLSTEVPKADGFVFRGWYTDEALTKKASETFVASEDVTFYAKWDVAITLTYNYLNGGANKDVVVNLYANDKVATLQAVDFDWEGKKFAGWFTKDGSADGDWGGEFKANTVLTANTTVYAKWVTPHFMMGSYKGYNVYGNDTASSSTLTVDMYGTGISDYNAETGYFNFNGKYAYYDAVNKMIVRGGKYVDKSFGTDVYYYFLADSVSVTKSDIVSWNSNKSRLIPFVIGGAENATIVFINDTEVYAGAAWTAVDENGAAVSGLANVASKAKYLTITCGSKVYELGKKSGSFVALDGYQGTYTSGEYSVTLDGLGNITGVLVGTYTKAADDAGYTFDVKTTNKEAYKLTVKKEDSTCTYVTNTVTFTYVNDKKAVSPDTVFVGIQTPLPSGDAVAVEGYIFRGWYTDDTYTTKVTTVTPSVDATYYAKYDIKVTLTIVYGNGLANATHAFGVGDALNMNKYVLAYTDGMAFDHWYTLGDDGTTQTEFAATTIDADITVYAAYVTAACPFVGTFKGVYLPSRTSNYDYLNLSANQTITFAADGTVSGYVSGTVQNYDATTGTFNVVDGTTVTKFISDAKNGVFAYVTSGGSWYVFLTNTSELAKYSTSNSAAEICSMETAVFTVKATDADGVVTVRTVVLNKDSEGNYNIYGNATVYVNGSVVENGGTVGGLKDSVRFVDANGNTIVEYVKNSYSYKRV